VYHFAHLHEAFAQKLLLVRLTASMMAFCTNFISENRILFDPLRKVIYLTYATASKELPRNFTSWNLVLKDYQKPDKHFKQRALTFLLHFHMILKIRNVHRGP